MSTNASRLSLSGPPNLNTPCDIMAQTPTLLPASAAAFMETGIAVVDVGTLADEDKTCAICYVDYESSDESEIAVKINVCGHVFGNGCLERHVTGTRKSCQECPLCRTRLFGVIEREHSVEEMTEEELFARIDELEGESDALHEHLYDCEEEENWLDDPSPYHWVDEHGRPREPTEEDLDEHDIAIEANDEEMDLTIERINEVERELTRLRSRFPARIAHEMRMAYAERYESQRGGFW